MLFSRRSLVMQVCTFVVSYSLFVASLGAAPRMSPPVLLPAANIVLDKAEVTISSKQSIEVKATVFDRVGKDLPNRRITWTILQGSIDLLSLERIDRLGTSVLITSNAASPSASTVLIRAHSGSAAAILTVHLQDSEPAEVVFPEGTSVELAPQDKKTVKAYVYDKQGHRMSEAKVHWYLADSDLKVFVDVVPKGNKDGVHSAQIIWLPGKFDKKAPAEIKLVARSDDAEGIFTIKYQSPKPEEVKIEVKSKDKTDPLSLLAGESKTMEVLVLGKDKAVLDIDPKDFTVEVADESSRDFIKVIVAKNEKEKTFNVSVIALPGTPQKAPQPFIDTQLIFRVRDVMRLLMPVSFRREASTVTWDILPPNIVGDNYGRTIKNDFYCIEVTIQNNSGSDLALAGLSFFKDVLVDAKNTDGSVKMKADGSVEKTYIRQFRPNTTYATVHGSLEKRKLTHPRALTLSIVDGLGSLLTAFVPFFHVDAHKANFSTVVDIVSNPFAKGLANGWKDSYPDEVRRFEADVLRDDKIIPNNTIFKTKMFIPKRAVFDESKVKDPQTGKSSMDKREDLGEVKKELGSLMVLGYRFEKGPIQPIYQGL